MTNIVDFGTGRHKPRRSIEVAQSGARILFFTGVRYERIAETEAPPFVAEPKRFYPVVPAAFDADPVAARHAPA